MNTRGQLDNDPKWISLCYGYLLMGNSQGGGPGEQTLWTSKFYGFHAQKFKPPGQIPEYGSDVFLHKCNLNLPIQDKYWVLK